MPPTARSGLGSGEQTVSSYHGTLELGPGEAEDLDDDPELERRHPVERDRGDPVARGHPAQPLPVAGSVSQGVLTATGVLPSVRADGDDAQAMNQ